MTEIEDIVNEAMTVGVLPTLSETSTLGEMSTLDGTATRVEPVKEFNETEQLRERLIGVAEAGKSREYLGKTITSTEIDRLDQKSLTRLYGRYEAHMGGIVTRSMKKHFVTAYVNLVGLFLPKNLAITDRDALEESLNEGPFIDLALNKWTCGLYHRFGHMLAPLEAVLLTSNGVKKVDFPPEAKCTVDDSPSIDVID